MQQCLEPHPNHSRLGPNGIKNIFKFKNLTKINAHVHKYFVELTHFVYCIKHTNFSYFHFALVMH